MSELVEVTVLTSIPKSLTYKKGNFDLRVGSLVRVPLLNRKVLGVVCKMNPTCNFPVSKLKAVHEVLYDTPIMNPELLKLAAWIQSYYAATPESTLETMIPAPIRKGMEHKRISLFQVKEDVDDQAFKRSPKQLEVYQFLKAKRIPIPKSKLLEMSSSGTIKALLEKGYIEESFETQDRDVYTDDLSEAEAVGTTDRELTEEQGHAVDDISTSLDADKFKVHLLHGVTGSGKTEVYLRLIQKALAEGGGVLFLVPEVALTPQTVGRLRSRLQSSGLKSVVWHSNLSDGERLDAWMSLARGDAQVVVGARSAVFAPVSNLKLVIVDEEHEPAYKQGENPRYHGRDVAVYRALLSQAVCVLGSATPSLESLNNAHNGKYAINKLTKRVDDREMPLVHVIDMKPEMMKAKGPVTLSQVLIDKLQDRLEKKEQSILFINRRGYTSRMLCPECEYVAECKHCSVSLTYHRTDNQLKCHVCGFQQKAPKVCPNCRSDKIKWKGYGTQKIEDVVSKVLPNANILRMDADTMSKKNRFREILADFRKGKIDILIGTQMIAKGLDFPNVTLVGLIDADLSLHIQDFRAAERTFQLIVQVAGRAGRGDRAGEVIVQSYVPHSPPIQFARRNDFDGYLEEELEQRKEFNYPPYRHLIRHVFRSRNPEKAKFFIAQWANKLEKVLPQGIELRGPSPAPLEKMKDYHRFHLWMFTPNVTQLIPKIMEARNTFKMDDDVIDVIDVDPVDMG